MGELYRHLFNGLLFVGRRPVFWIGIGLLAAGYAASGLSPIDALPWAVVWALVAGASRMLLGVLPRPSEGGGMSKETPPPAPQLAVDIVPGFAPLACPDLATMQRHLPEELNRLLQAS